MKKQILLGSKVIAIAITSSLFLFSCSNENADQTYLDVASKYIPEPIVLPTSSLEWDESYHPDDKILTRSDDNHSHEMAVTNSNLYVGGVYSAASVQDLTFNWISKPVDPIDISYTFPRYYFDNIPRPSVSAMYRSLNKATGSPNFTGKQSLYFEYDFREFSYYRELKLAFGANVNIASVFKLDASVNSQKIKSKSALFARIVQKNFSVVMDYPYDGNIFLNNGDLNSVQAQSPVYVNSIIFGRMGIIAIESEYTYNELKTAFKAALTAGKINGELNLSTEYKKILQESSMKIFISGGKGQDVARIVEGYNEFKNFIINGGEFTQEVPGVPIFFTANYVQDNSVFNTTFTTAQ